MPVEIIRPDPDKHSQAIMGLIMELATFEKCPQDVHMTAEQLCNDFKKGVFNLDVLVGV